METIWEVCHNRILNLGEFISHEKVNHISIEDAAFDNDKTKSVIQLLYDEKPESEAPSPIRNMDFE